MNPTLLRNIFFGLGLLAAVWFFVGYPSQDPRSLIDLSHADMDTVEQRAKANLETFGYDYSNYQLESRFIANHDLLQNLQQTIGRKELLAQFQNKAFPNMRLFYWEINFRELQTGSHQSSGSPNARKVQNRPDSESGAVNMRLDENGNFLAMIAENVMPASKVNRSALAGTFGSYKDTASSVLSSYSDQELTDQLLVDLQQNWSSFNLPENERLSLLRSALESQAPFRLSPQDIFEIGSFYLQKTGWNTAELEQDTVRLGRENENNTVTAQYLSRDPTLSQELSLEVQLTPGGGLLGISSSYNSIEPAGENNGLWSTVKGALIFLFVLGGVVLFFFRIRARAIDTQPALIVSVVAGLGVSVMVLLASIPDMDLFAGDGAWTQSIELVVRTGLAGAGSSLAFFVLFAIGDSIIRQHWPQKLNIYNYIRQGMLFNKPVGYMLVSSVTLAFILAGVWTLVLWSFPKLSFHLHHEIFFSQKSALPPIFVMMSNGIFSLSFVISVFLVLGGQVVAQTKSKIIASVLMVLACGVVVPFQPIDMEGGMYQILAGAVMGLVMVGIYLRWDFLTLLVSHFLFLGLAGTASGWVIPGSLDTYIFISVLALIGVLFTAGIIAITRGREEQTLPSYVPPYVEELAQEERIKQELQIAREVQQSFLPVRTPEFENLELAAICKPAYETGGDYYDFVQLDDHRVAVMIGDVSGKGIQAAFYMTFVKGIIHSLCRETDSPAEVLKKTNRLFCENAPRGTFISLVYGIVDLEKRTFHFARAGHNPILRITSANGSLEQLQPSGIGIGLAKGDSFEKQIEEVETPISGDDMLVLYTDGIVEALNERKTFYGTQRLNSMLKRNQEKSAKDILELLSQDVKSFVGKAKQHDDMTMLIMKLKNTNH